MKIMNCPLNGPRNISEFICGGDIVSRPDPDTCNDQEWAEFVFIQANEAGIVREWWCHVPSAYWFIAERNTITDEIIRTYQVAEIFPPRGRS